jgi:hypothetical protein
VKKFCYLGAQDRVVELKGHERLVKLLLWYDANDPKGKPSDNKTMTHLKTACTIANVLGHAILSDPKVRTLFLCGA